MREQRDDELLALAVERGLVSPEQVQQCRELREGSSAHPPRSLLRLLVERGFLAPDQVVQLASGRNIPDVKACELARELGASTVATSCVVRDPKSGQQYLLKVLHPAYARRADVVRRLHHDAALAVRISHPNVARTLGSGEALGDVFLLAEYVEGASLGELVEAKDKVEKGEALSVALAAARALACLHERDLVHGHLSPSNLLVAHDGTVKLADVALPVPPVGELAVARRGQGLRAPHYLSPEHLDREPRLDVRSDLFCLGAVLYHAVSGRPPFRGDTTAEVSLAIRQGDFLALKEAAPDASAAFASIVDKLLQPDPARRYQTPQELLADLEAHQAGRVPEAHRLAIAGGRAAKAQEAPSAEGPEEPEAAAPRRKGPWLAAAVACVALVGAGVWFLARPGAKERAAEEAGEDPEETRRHKRLQAAAREVDHIFQQAAAGETEGQAHRAAIEKLREIEKEHAGGELAEVAREAREKRIALEADAAFQEALAYARQHPEDRASIVDRYQSVVDQYPDTEGGFRASQELEEIQDAQRKKIQSAIQELERKAEELAGQRRFGEAKALYDQFLKGRLPDLLKDVTGEAARKDILQSVNERFLQNKIDLSSRAEQAYLDVHEKAQEKMAGRYYAEAKALYAEVVQTFGTEEEVSKARAQIALIQPLLDSAASRRLKAIDAVKYEYFVIRLEPSLKHARGWDFAAAAREAQKLRPKLEGENSEAYLDAYLGDLALLRTLRDFVVRRLNAPDAEPLFIKSFSLGRIDGKFNRDWFEARVLGGDEDAMVVRYRGVEVHRPWGEFSPRELYNVGRLALDAQNRQRHLLLGIHCLYAGLPKVAAREFQDAKASGLEVDSYVQRAALLEGDRREEVAPTKQEEASLLLLEAKRMFNERAWDRALYRFALLRARHQEGQYDITESLAEVNRHIARCKRHVASLRIETDLALGRQVDLLAHKPLDEWEQRFGTWTLEDGVLRGQAGDEQDAECLLSLHHAPSYELRAAVRVVEGTGALLRLAGKGRPNLGFWLNVQNPKLVGLVHAGERDDRPAERTIRPFQFEAGTWYELKASVNPAYVEVALPGGYVVRRPNPLSPDPQGLRTYGLLVNPTSTVELRHFSVRVLQEQ
ncbi:MAG: protein kinase domain-containing protein [bacterium]